MNLAWAPPRASFCGVTVRRAGARLEGGRAAGTLDGVTALLRYPADLRFPTRPLRRAPRAVVGARAVRPTSSRRDGRGHATADSAPRSPRGSRDFALVQPAYESAEGAG